MLDDEIARNLYETANHIGLDSIFEVHDEQEYDRALNLNAKIIGINNRNLHTFETDIMNTIKLSSKFSKDHIIISESGIFNKKEINMLNKCGVNAYLIGESIIRNNNIIDSTKKLIE
jgi:indole-3-glycerol phosphate synthase